MDWRRRSVLLFLAICFLLRSQAAAGDNTWDLTEEEESELERKLKTLNKPYVKSFKDEYGTTYDCVDIYKQPAFDHPLLKNHTLQVTYHLLHVYIYIYIASNTFTNFIA
ncbi:hypothetical protein MUK42_11957 [Musa troglodytarum]|uniref:Neprosin activation peptide domain-containing protein n=1 Tax=Musa troglodytarum TaxID=320322 RepID=A0A9E7GPT9_9LILI|nr:hypothetical protein MUK42_11957 [Musa troglodytarum]